MSFSALNIPNAVWRKNTAAINSIGRKSFIIKPYIDNYLIRTFASGIFSPFDAKYLGTVCKEEGKQSAFRKMKYNINAKTYFK